MAEKFWNWKCQVKIYVTNKLLSTLVIMDLSVNGKMPTKFCKSTSYVVLMKSSESQMIAFNSNMKWNYFSGHNSATLCLNLWQFCHGRSRVLRITDYITDSNIVCKQNIQAPKQKNQTIQAKSNRIKLEVSSRMH